MQVQTEKEKKISDEQTKLICHREKKRESVFTVSNKPIYSLNEIQVKKKMNVIKTKTEWSLKFSHQFFIAVLT